MSHPYMANSTESIKLEMLNEIGVESIDELFSAIPSDHIMKGDLNLPPALTSEMSLKRHMTKILNRNDDCESNLSFLGGGIWQHHVPAICDQVVNRYEFLTPAWGNGETDHGRLQTWFEYASQLGELIDMEMVSLPVYTWGAAAGHAIRMATRLTGKKRVLLPETTCPERLSVIQTFCQPEQMNNSIEVVQIGSNPETGMLNLNELEEQASKDVSAIYIEIPSYLGVIETQAREIGDIAKKYDIEFIIGVDPSSLGILNTPGSLGADIVVGTTQPLGVHMHGGGGLGGFMATRDEERYAYQHNSILISAVRTIKPGELAFERALLEQTSYGAREEGNDFIGTSTFLWAIPNAVYMALLGPKGFQELGERIIRNSHYAAREFEKIPGVELVFKDSFFKEFILRYDGAKKTVDEINRELRSKGVFGGIDLSKDFPQYGQSALWAVTEIHEKEDIDQAVNALREVLIK